jgi:hypothetical protein
MTESLNRDEIIALLERLGGDADADVLAAARALHAATTNAGIAWADLLVPEDTGDRGDVVDSVADEPVEAVADEPVEAVADEPVEAVAEPPAKASARDAEALALIEKLLARPGVTETFRDEMAGYKRDIADGAFENADHRYLAALHKRLSGKR